MKKNILYISIYLYAATLAHANQTITYKVGNLEGELAEEFKINSQIKDLISDNADRKIILLTNKNIDSLSQDDIKNLQNAYRSFSSIIILDAAPEKINFLHRSIGTGQYYGKTNKTKNIIAAYCFMLRKDNGFSQMTLYYADNNNHQKNAHAYAKHIITWATQFVNKSPRIPKKSTNKESQEQQPADLTELVSAWTDSRVLSVNGENNSNQSMYQCTVSVWQAYQVSSKSDFYYAQEVCNYPTGNIYTQLGKKVSYPTAFNKEKWSNTAWENTGDYCRPSNDAGNNYTACRYAQYGKQYEVGLTPLLPDSETIATSPTVSLIMENPQTTVNTTTVTEGVSWTIGGEVVAGSDGASVSVNTGVTVENSSTTTISDVTITNSSLSTGENGLWQYNMTPVTIHDDSCDDSMEPPSDVQTSTFQSQQYFVWQVQSTYRSDENFNNYYVLQPVLKISLGDSSVYVNPGSWYLDNPSNCNMFGCSCSIVENDPPPAVLPSQPFYVPVPSTDFE